ncbi:GerW family sporulation protein [Aquibacillus sp. 3ASR75-11]|uniref:GerW family sporulation protein n=1 Tax=Terrihalobacillus insolitus TaxID=2950438 RepID=A0A9X3WTL4_9BACI|nr:GerW family sporulation protein [Terrihalobacillus insolitus]MDC3412661.1 GerW family sporulation protein [Terrihalobacillus insolitus]MDC3424011.1 GerW family sporulation protein [Terrihalobacillus insolitus]
MSEHPIQGLMTTAMENLKDMIDVNTIVGDPIESPDGSVIIPVSKVGFGFAAGGSEFNPSQSQSGSDSEGDSESFYPFGGGSGGGVSITPIAFLIVNDKGVQMVHLDENTHLYERLLDLAPQAVEKIQDLLKGTTLEKGNKDKKKDKPKKKEKKKEQDAHQEDEEDEDEE